ncbi:MAG: TATA-box-binding protein [Promethearchaeota archaeon]
MEAEKIAKSPQFSQKKPRNSVTLRIENIVATVTTNTTIDLDKLLLKYSDIERKNNFPGLITKFSKPKATLLIFSSGKIVLTGVKLEKHIPAIVEKILDKFDKAGIQIDGIPEVKIENLVGRTDFKTKINLDISSLILERAIYEPEVFPGLIYKLKKPEKICFLIFSSGKVICTGANNIKSMTVSLKDLASKLKKNGLIGGKKAEIKSEKAHKGLLDLS